MKRILSIPFVIGALIAVTASAGAQSIDLASGGADPIWRGAQSGAKAGALLDQGALNSGDTRRDLIVGAPGGPTVAGTVYIINGGPIRTGDLSLAGADTVVHGAAVGDLFGAATASGSVLTLESAGTPALIVGAPGAMDGRGIVYVFAGGFHSGDSLTPANAVVQIVGGQEDQLGAALATGDLNRDGYREIIIGAPGSHRVYVIAGGPSLTGTVDLSLSPTPAAMLFDAPGVGGSVAAGDVNGDGIYDLLVGQPTSSNAYLFKGRNGTMPTAAFDSAFSGVDVGDAAGAAIRLADLNDDGVNDVIISAPYGDGPDNTRTDAGEAYVILGGAGIASRSLANADVTFYGKEAGGHFSAILASGDINRDTPNDLVSASPAAHGGTGSVDIYYGRKSGFGVARADGRRVVDFATEAPSRTILGDTAGGTITAIQVFEVTGEGARDVIVGMSGNNGGVGAVYFTISPRLKLGSSSVSLTGDQGLVSSAPIPVRNISAIPITWRTVSNRPWLSATPSGSTSASAFGDVVITANGNGLLPGTYTGTISVVSTSIHLTMSQPIAVTFTVRERPGYPNPTTAPVAGQPAGAIYNILFRNSTDGYLALWQMNGNTLTGVQALSVNQMTIAAWRIAGYADLNGDGERDIVWQQDLDGSLGVWFMRGQQVMSTVYLSINKVDPNWKIRAAGDVNGDGKADLIFQHTDGSLGIWLMDGAQVLASSYLSIRQVTDTNWKIVGAGDTNGDGRVDIVWQNKATGVIGVWMMNGSQVVSTRVLSIGMNDPKWTVMSVVDVNGDGSADILWQNDDGTLATWWLYGPQVIGTFYLNPSHLGNPSWKIAGPK